MKILKFMGKTFLIILLAGCIINTMLDVILDAEAKETILNNSNEISRVLYSGVLSSLSSKEDDTKEMTTKTNNTSKETVTVSEGKKQVSVTTDKKKTKESEVSKTNVAVDSKKVEQKESTNIKSKNTCNNFIFVGDSRTVAYSGIVDTKDYDFVTFIAEISKGYDWFNSEALNKIEEKLDDNKSKYNVVLNLGINDLQNIDKYIKAYNDLASKYDNHNFYVVSVNRVDSKKMTKFGYSNISNSQIESFNNKLKTSLSKNIHFIDSYSYFKNKTVQTTDGLHYTNKTSLSILEYITKYVKGV